MRTTFAASLIAVSLFGSTMIASAQTPAAGPGAAGGATVGSDVKAADTARETGVTTGMSTTQQGVAPRSPTGAPVPNAAVSKPPADAAAPAGR